IWHPFDPEKSPESRWDRHFRRMTWSGYLLSTPFGRRPRILEDSPFIFGAPRASRGAARPRAIRLFHDNALATGREQVSGGFRRGEGRDDHAGRPVVAQGKAPTG